MKCAKASFVDITYSLSKKLKLKAARIDHRLISYLLIRVYMYLQIKL